MGFYSCTVPSFEQMTLTRFLAEGYFEKHLNRMKKYYRTVRAGLLRTLSAGRAAERFAVHDAGAGLHLVLEVRGAAEPDALRAQLAQAGIRASLLSDFYIGTPPEAAGRSMVLDYADAEPEQLSQALERLAAALAEKECGTDEQASEGGRKS